MKKIYLLLLLSVFTLTAFAQQRQYVGDVIVECVDMSRTGEDLHMELDIHIDAVAMNKKQSWAITPEISSADNSIVYSFPYVLINGRTKRQLYERKIRFENTELLSDLPYMLVNVNKDTDTTFRYIIDVPYESWMQDGDLNIRQELTSCRGIQQLFLVKLDNYLDRGYSPLLVMPQVSFILPDQEQVIDRAQIHYHLDRTEIDRGFMDNPEELERIRRISEMAQRPDMQNSRLYIDGYASPEGPYGHNAELSRDRAQRLKNYIRDTYGIPEDRFTTTNTAEDWRTFRELVMQSSVSHKSEILGIIDSNDDYDNKERRLKAIDGGRPYRTLLSEVLPKLRRAEYYVEYTLGNYSDDDFHALLSKRPEELSQRELFLIAQHYNHDSDEFNRVYSDMMNRYGEHPTACHNAAAFMLVKGENFSARQYLDKSPDTAEKLNNQGVYYMQTGELDRAEDMFRRASDRGVPEARHNLAELDKLRSHNRSRR